MTWNQFLGWAAYHNLEPFGDDRADYRTSVLASIHANTYRDKKKKATPFSPIDFMKTFFNRNREGVVDTAQRTTTQPMEGVQGQTVWNRFKNAFKKSASR